MVPTSGKSLGCNVKVSWEKRAVEHRPGPVEEFREGFLEEVICELGSEE